MMRSYKVKVQIVSAEKQHLWKKGMKRAEQLRAKQSAAEVIAYNANDWLLFVSLELMVEYWFVRIL